MKAVVQRVKRASVTVDGEVTGSIDQGLLVFLGIHQDDTDEMIEKMAGKIAKLRIFEDEEGKMSRSVEDIGGSVLMVSQFTLYGDVRKGNRPSFIESARPEKAEPMYEAVVESIRGLGLPVETGRFTAMMDVELVNDGPVTILIEL
ncbi:MAG: D-tyrosyl-tRNA(Tyr) deacylase [Parcubacteria group bacterium]|nr:D-tyrosyl-tRNA(Tyr) deacylase [Parcubacteria group bacterium]